MADIIERDWYNLYADGWQGEITPEAFAHPAKFARGLIRRIYEHALEMEWIKPGDIVLDPFGGVALGALDAMKHGLHFIGVELEPKFVELGQQNIALWNDLAKRATAWGLDGWGSAVLLQGDSRQLASIVGGADGQLGTMPEGSHALAISSPPYAASLASDDPDEAGFRFYAVVGRVLDRPEISLRLGMYGDFCHLPVTTLFTNSGPFVDRFHDDREKESNDE